MLLFKDYEIIAILKVDELLAIKYCKILNYFIYNRAKNQDIWLDVKQAICKDFLNSNEKALQYKIKHLDKVVSKAIKDVTKYHKPNPSAYSQVKIFNQNPTYNPFSGVFLFQIDLHKKLDKIDLKHRNFIIDYYFNELTKSEIEQIYKANFYTLQKNALNELRRLFKIHV